MPCYKPISMKQLKTMNSNGNYSIVSHKSPKDGKNIMLPCQRCNGCRLEYARQWAQRCCDEMTLWKRNTFVTLTYADDALTYGGSEHGILVPRHLTLFWKRLRKSGPRFRYFAAGEYGERRHRPHYHAIIFGHDFSDKTYQTTKNGYHYYSSRSLNRIWGHGDCIIGDATFESASYVARYVMKKRKGKDSKYYKENGITPEFVVMSRRPGIGAEFYDRYESDMFPLDRSFSRNHAVTPPKYYTRRYKATHPLLAEDMIRLRVERAEKNWENNTPKRLRVRERINASAIKLLLRDLDL